MAGTKRIPGQGIAASGTLSLVPGLRPARVDDAATLASIDAQQNFSAWSPRQFEEACSTPMKSQRSLEEPMAGTWVLEDRGSVVGFFVFSQVLDEATIHAIAVDEDYQGQGLGRSLLLSALVKMQYAGATRCLLEVRRSNTVAQALYCSEGFVLDGERLNYYRTASGAEDALLMSRQLGEPCNERA